MSLLRQKKRVDSLPTDARERERRSFIYSAAWAKTTGKEQLSNCGKRKQWKNRRNKTKRSRPIVSTRILHLSSPPAFATQNSFPTLPRCPCGRKSERNRRNRTAGGLNRPRLAKHSKFQTNSKTRNKANYISPISFTNASCFILPNAFVNPSASISSEGTCLITSFSVATAS
jgi:hypothetical protein